MKSQHTKGLRIVIDILVLLSVFSPVLVTELYTPLTAVKRGFYCDDESIAYPYHASSVSILAVICIGVCINIIAILIHVCRQAKASHSGEEPYRLCSLNHKHLQVYDLVFLFLFGLGCEQSVTNVLKFTIGRLRPNFLSICRPDFASFSCTNDSRPLYITADVCTGRNQRLIREMRLSFPSGHASLAVYCTVFFVLFTSKHMRNVRFPSLLVFVQCSLTLVSVYTCSTRVSDYKHHAEDVLAGVGIGAVFACITNYCLSRQTPLHEVDSELIQLVRKSSI